MALHEDVERIETRDELAAFVERLRVDYETNPERWENDTITSYLEALAAWTEDMPGYFENRGINMDAVPKWRLLGMMLLAATSYE